MTEISLGNFYEINKELMKNEPVLDIILFNKKIQEIAEEMKTNFLNGDNHYWMLLCNDRKDYTVFNIISMENIITIENELRPTLKNRGDILSIDKKGNDCWEIWIRNEHNKENFVYYLFKYNDGIIEINE